MKKKGFTLVELLVVIAIIAMLLAILMPALNKVRQIAYRMVCGSNLSGIGKACLVYANDYEEAYPITNGGTTTTPLQWGIPNSTEFWDLNTTTNTTFQWSTVTKTTVTSSLYLLVKYADVSTAQFVCKATDAKKFELTTDTTKQNGTTNIKDVTEAWDFGKSTNSGTNATGSWNYCSYAYQLPYAPTTGKMVKVTLSASSQAGAVVLADASPWYKAGKKVAQVAPTATAVGTGPYLPTNAEWGNTTAGANKDRIKLANSTNHQQEGQNVLYGDSHVSFETQSNVGITQDNIYTYWLSDTSNTSTTLSDVMSGTVPASDPGPSVGSYNEADSFLVN